MTNKTKIIVCILLILAIVILIFGIVSSNKHDKKENEDEISKVIDEYMNDENEEENENENLELPDNIIEEDTETNTQIIENNVVNINENENIIGKEEQESSKENIENIESNNKKLAIELAKKEWAISIDSYDFQVSEVKSDGTYDVSVINNTDRNVITIYNVNIQLGTVTE